VTIVQRSYLRCSGPCQLWLAIDGTTTSFDTPGLARKAARANGWTTRPGKPEVTDLCPNCQTPKET
jgi:hypothetical protein